MLLEQGKQGFDQTASALVGRDLSVSDHLAVLLEQNPERLPFARKLDYLCADARHRLPPSEGAASTLLLRSTFLFVNSAVNQESLARRLARSTKTCCRLHE